MNIRKEQADVWWQYLRTYSFPVVKETFEALSSMCEEKCEHCHLILCRRLDDTRT